MINKTGDIISGFTLIELMIVVVIVGLLAAIAIPRFMQAAVKSKLSEARLILKQLWLCDQVYYEDTGDFYGAFDDAGITGISDIGFDAVSGSPRFDYFIIIETDPYYVAEAFLPSEGGDASLEGYELYMDREGNFVFFEQTSDEDSEKKGKGRRGKRGKKK